MLALMVRRAHDYLTVLQNIFPHLRIQVMRRIGSCLKTGSVEENMRSLAIPLARMRLRYISQVAREALQLLSVLLHNVGGEAGFRMRLVLDDLVRLLRPCAELWRKAPLHWKPLVGKSVEQASPGDITEDLQLPCDQGDRVFQTKQALAFHHMRVHGWRKLASSG